MPVGLLNLCVISQKYLFKQLPYEDHEDAFIYNTAKRIYQNTVHWTCCKELHMQSIDLFTLSYLWPIEITLPAGFYLHASKLHCITITICSVFLFFSSLNLKRNKRYKKVMWLRDFYPMLWSLLLIWTKWTLHSLQ